MQCAEHVCFIYSVLFSLLVLADAHFPTSSICKMSGAKEIRADGEQFFLPQRYIDETDYLLHLQLAEIFYKNNLLSI